MRGDLTPEFRAASARLGNVHRLEVDHGVALKNVESMSERTDHGVVANIRNFFKAGNDGHGAAKRRPVGASEVPLQGKREHAAVFVRLRHAQTLYDALHVLGVL